MSRVAKSMIVWAMYMFVAGAALMAIPNKLLRLFGISLGIPPTDEPWIRIVGVLTLCLGYCYLQAGLKRVDIYARWSVHTRIGLNLFLAVLAISGLAPWGMILFGLVDLGGAAWTWWALREGQ